MSRNNFRSRSYVKACNSLNNTCVKEGEVKQVGTAQLATSYTATICTGDSSCEGELAWCREEARKGEECPNEYNNQERVQKRPNV